MSEARGPNPPDQPDDPSWKAYVTDLLSSISAVVLVGLLLFAVSGVWPPLVAIESKSMSPNIHVGDLVFVMEEERFAGEVQQGETGVVTAHAAQSAGYSKFQKPGDVIVYAPDGNNQTTPIIHRAMFWVEDGENWYDEANPEYVGAADSCEELNNCPANESGFITKGDYNGQYDQVTNLSGPVKASWVIGTAEVRVPWLGCIRLSATGAATRPGACELL
ncbi:S26 family signal peptidase [Halobacteria archaeon HArc-gm2]|nr:S26 family signal peptidase [Halobacteria archaeon HArc-gm2]